MKSLEKTASSRTSSQVTWPNDNKAVGNCFHALIAGLRPVSLILARRIAFSLVLLGAGLALIQPCAGQSGTWTATGSLANAGTRTATLLPNGKVLVAGVYLRYGYPPTYFSTAAELYDPASGTWAATGIPVIPFRSLTATLLPNGKVLVTGARVAAATSAVAELYDPASGTWSATGSLRTARYSYTATLLPNGKVLVAGGEADSNSNPLASAELYDPASGTWRAAGSLRTARYSHTATLLPNGKVLVAGGITSNYVFLASAELYDPASGTWSATGSLATTRFLHTETLLPNGKVLVAGGEGGDGDTGDYLPRAELYDPANGTWRATGSLATGRIYHTETLLPNGKVLVAGGFNGFDLASAELYDPASGTWSATGSLRTARYSHTATLLPNGNVLVAGPGASAELYHTPAPLSTLGNISTRAFVQTGENVLIGGFIITGTHTKRVLLRAIGPSLALAGKLMNPTMELHDSSGALIVSNDNWGSASNHQEIANTGAAPTNALESAIVRSLAPGRYTAIVRGVGNTTGIALVEGYDLDRTVDSKFANISSRGLVQTGNNVMIGGFTILGAGSEKVIIRAIGPSLPLAGKLSNPTLELHNAQGALIASNDNWRTTQQAEIIATGIPPSNNLESAIVRTLTPGNYTAIVRGVSNTTGLALVEVYALN